MASIEVYQPNGESHTISVQLQDYDRAFLAVSRQGVSIVPEHPTAPCLTTIGGRWLLLSSIDDDITVNGTDVVGLSVLTHQDRIKFGGVEMTFLGEVPYALTADVPEVRRKVRSPYARAVFTVGTEVVRCPNCGLLHLLAEWEELSYCAGHNCGYPIHMGSDEQEATDE